MNWRIPLAAATALALGGCVTYPAGYYAGGNHEAPYPGDNYVGSTDGNGGYYQAPPQGSSDPYPGYFDSPYATYNFGLGYGFGPWGFGYDPWFYQPWWGFGWGWRGGWHHHHGPPGHGPWEHAVMMPNAAMAHGASVHGHFQHGWSHSPSP